MSQSRSFGQTWGMPFVLATLSAIGLLSALLGDGIWDLLSWVTLSSPLAVIMWAMARGRRGINGSNAGIGR